MDTSKVTSVLREHQNLALCSLTQRCECICNVPHVFHLSHCLRPQMSERLLDVENEAMLKIVELEKQLMQTNKELDHIRVRNQINFFFPPPWRQ